MKKNVYMPGAFVAGAFVMPSRYLNRKLVCILYSLCYIPAGCSTTQVRPIGLCNVHPIDFIGHTLRDTPFLIEFEKKVVITTETYGHWIVI